MLCLVAQSYLTLCDPVDITPPGSSVHGGSPGMNTGVGCHALLQGIFPTQGSNPGLPHCRRVFYCVSHQGSPELLAISRNWLILGGSKRPQMSEHQNTENKRPVNTTRSNFLYWYIPFKTWTKSLDIPFISSHKSPHHTKTFVSLGLKEGKLQGIINNCLFLALPLSGINNDFPLLPSSRANSYL